jgi:glycosyltransferase involved in cell wall biosynthesis
MLYLAGGGDLCLYSWLFGKLLRKKRLYFSQNLIIRSDGKHDGLKNRIRYLLYKKALHSKNFMTTVNAPQLVDFYAEMFSCNKNRFVVTYDNRATDLEEQNEKAENIGEPYVFAGGVAGRDVDTFVKVVKLLPQINFKCVFPKNMLISGMEELKNLEVFSDIPEKEFYRIMNDATICCIPLKSKAPCGLYTMQHAVLTGLPIVSTDTWSMRTIISDDNCGYLLPMGDAKAMAEKVRLLMDNEDLRNTVIANAKKNFSKFEPHNVGKQLCDAIDDFVKEQNFAY